MLSDPIMVRLTNEDRVRLAEEAAVEGESMSSVARRLIHGGLAAIADVREALKHGQKSVMGAEIVDPVELKGGNYGRDGSHS